MQIRDVSDYFCCCALSYDTYGIMDIKKEVGIRARIRNIKNKYPEDIIQMGKRFLVSPTVCNIIKKEVRKNKKKCIVEDVDSPIIVEKINYGEIKKIIKLRSFSQTFRRPILHQ